MGRRIGGIVMPRRQKNARSKPKKNHFQIEQLQKQIIEMKKDNTNNEVKQAK